MKEMQTPLNGSNRKPSSLMYLLTLVIFAGARAGSLRSIIRSSWPKNVNSIATSPLASKALAVRAPLTPLFQGQWGKRYLWNPSLPLLDMFARPRSIGRWARSERAWDVLDGGPRRTPCDGAFPLVERRRIGTIRRQASLRRPFGSRQLHPNPCSHRHRDWLERIWI